MRKSVILETLDVSIILYYDPNLGFPFALGSETAVLSTTVIRNMRC